MINLLKNKVKIFDNTSFWRLFIGTVIFGICLSTLMSFEKKHDPICLWMSSWKTPLEDCYWKNKN